MTPKEKIDRYFRDIEAEAERYRDKEIDVDPEERREIRLEFIIGQVVYLGVSDHQAAGVVTHATINPNGVLYHVTWGDTRMSTSHYAMELTVERPL